MNGIFNGGKSEQKNVISKDAAWELLSTIPSSIEEPSFQLVSASGNLFGVVSAETFHKLSSKKSVVAVEVHGKKAIFHENHRKSFKMEIRISTMPEGAVLFPEENFIIVAPEHKDRRERAKFFKRMLHGYTGLNIEDDAIVVKGASGGEFFMVPVIDVSGAPVLKWAVSPNNSKGKYAWVFDKLDDAVVKLRALENELTAKVEKTKAA